MNTFYDAISRFAQLRKRLRPLFPLKIAGFLSFATDHLFHFVETYCVDVSVFLVPVM